MCKQLHLSRAEWHHPRTQEPVRAGECVVCHLCHIPVCTGSPLRLFSQTPVNPGATGL